MEQLELFAPSEIDAPKTISARTTDEERPVEIGTATDITQIDIERGRRELGECQDENGVSIWDVIAGLKRDGVTTVHFI